MIIESIHLDRQRKALLYRTRFLYCFLTKAPGGFWFPDENLVLQSLKYA